jgi:hypothetical protein
MKISVTQKHIDEGIRHDPCMCPIALAGSEAFKRTVIVGLNMLLPSYSIEAGAWDVLTLPAKAMKFMANFDDGLSVQPFEFEVDVP